MQIKQYLKPHYLIPAIYLLIVLVCIFLAPGFDIKDEELFLTLFVLTVPWSIVVGFFILATLHTGDNSIIVKILFMISASVNALLYYFAAKPERNVDKAG
jgi:glucan phosphoethanolaminetransferase (alkaline phosphatase superfamily)